MMKLAIVMAVMAGALLVSAVRADTASTPPPGVLNFTMKDIDGNDVDLSKYKGNVVMIVNGASLCGNTPQYKPLEAIYQKYKDQGFVVLVFPANNFGSQEPGSNAQIKRFCT